jgi:hypothetical protein
MATRTSTTFENYQPKNVHVGVMSVSGSLNLGATASSNGDILWLAKVPHGAIIVDAYEDHTTGASTQVLDFGLATSGAAGGGASLSSVIAGGAQATFNRMNVQGTARRVSVSDNDTNRYGIFGATVVSGSGTTSLKVNWTLQYRMDE